MRIRKGMKVRVIKGNHKGSEGKILFVFPKDNKAIVEGVNFIKRAVRPTQNNPSGCLLYTSPSPRDKRQSRMPSSA